jgi:isochorismate pyruvate lyase
MNFPEVSNLEEVRTNIDRVDRQIVALLAERQYFVKNAVRFKKSTDDVKAPARVEAVIAKVRNLATESNLDPGIAESIYRTMIDCFINNELNEFQHKNK